MFSLSTIVIAVCDVIIVVCFILLALRCRNLEKRVFSMRGNLDSCHTSLVSQMIDLNECRSLLSGHKRDIDSLRTDFRKLDDSVSFLENSHVALSAVVSDRRSLCDSCLTCKEVNPESTKKTTKKTVKNGKK